MRYTQARIEALSPDDASLKAGKKLATASKWPLLGSDEAALWGQCKGSGANPYSVMIDLEGPAFKCSCPSRKFPCKHALGLFLLYVDGALTAEDAPEWVAAWLDKRRSREDAKAARDEAKSKKDPETRARIEAKRLKTMRTGLQECETWLRDLASGGIAAMQDTWEHAAARLEDAKVPGAAGMVRQMQGAARDASPAGLEVTARLAGRLFAVIRAFARYETLSPDQQADLRVVTGWSIDKQEVIARGAPVTGTWTIIGERVIIGDSLREQRVWLYEPTLKRTALILNFAHGNAPLDLTMPPGIRFEADLVYYPGYPQRAVITRREANDAAADTLCGHATIREAQAAFAGAKAQNPWLLTSAVVLCNVIPIVEHHTFYLSDASGDRLPIRHDFKEPWVLLSLSGGGQRTIAGEYDGHTFLPLGFGGEDGYHPFASLREGGR